LGGICPRLALMVVAVRCCVLAFVLWLLFCSWLINAHRGNKFFYKFRCTLLERWDFSWWLIKKLKDKFAKISTVALTESELSHLITSFKNSEGWFKNTWKHRGLSLKKIMISENTPVVVFLN
jgi:hypothetical protein